MGEWVEWADDADCPLPWEVVGEDGSNVTDMGLRIAGGGTELLVPIGPKNGEKAPSSSSMPVCGGWGEGGGSEERRVERELTRGGQPMQTVKIRQGNNNAGGGRTDRSGNRGRGLSSTNGGMGTIMEGCDSLSQ